MRVLIVGDPDSRGALTAARALAAAGHRVGVASPARGLVSRSRAVRGRHALPDASLGHAAFGAAVGTTLRGGGYDTVFAAGDDWLAALAQVRDDLPVPLPYAPTEPLLRSMDKLDLASLAEQAGLRSPRTLEATDAACRDWSGPAVVKTRRHFSGGVVARDVRAEAVLVDDADGALAAARAVRAAGGEPVLQQVLGGRLLALTVLCDRSARPVARVQQVADAVWPVPAGVSTRATTTAVDPRLAAGLERMLAGLRWFGLAQAQFLDGPEGPALIDLNARYYGSMALSRAAGVELAPLWADLAAGHEVAPVPDAPPGVRYTWLEGDLRRAAAQRRGGLLADVAESLRWARGAAHSTGAAGDPAPLLHHTAGLGVRGMRKAWRRISS